MLCVRDDGGPALRSFTQDVLQRYQSYSSQASDHSALVNAYLKSAGRDYQPYVLVSSCPGDV